jgi:hypothetical protein
MKKTIFLIGIFLLVSVVSAQKTSIENKTFEKKDLKVTNAEKVQFKDFLKNKHTGIIKLLNNPCSNSLVIDANDEKCSGKSDFTFGSHYSFFAKVYFEKYQHIDYATLSFVQGEFVVKNNSSLIQLLVDLGDRSISEIDEQTKDVINLSSFPLYDKNEMKKFNKSGDGYEFRGLKINNRQPVGLNRTFLLLSHFETGFRSLVNSKKETLFVFKVVRQKDEVVTILWKQIYSKDI